MLKDPKATELTDCLRDFKIGALFEIILNYGARIKTNFAKKKKKKRKKKKPQ